MRTASSIHCTWEPRSAEVGPHPIRRGVEDGADPDPCHPASVHTPRAGDPSAPAVSTIAVTPRPYRPLATAIVVVGVGPGHGPGRRPSASATASRAADARLAARPRAAGGRAPGPARRRARAHRHGGRRHGRPHGRGEARRPLATGGKQLDLRAEVIDQKVQGIDAQLQRMGDLMATLQQERAEQHGQLITNLRTGHGHQPRRWPRPPSTCARRWPAPRPAASGASAWPTTCCGPPGWSRASATASRPASPAARSPTSPSSCPGGRELHMDVKFPVDNYLRHLEATSDRRARRRRPRPSSATCATG